MSFWINWKGQERERHGDFVSRELPAWVDANYRTRKGRAFRALMGDSTFGFIEIHRAGGRRGGATAGSGQPFVEFAVEDGIVTLDGEVPSLTHKRLAGVFAWWVPGSRDVINGMPDFMGKQRQKFGRLRQMAG